MFLTPIFYPISAIPEGYRKFININPLALVVEQARDVLIASQVPALSGLLVSWCVGVLVLWLGFAWFQKTRKGFADVI
jgi:lipopolysaccharide transport system permease protein